MAKRSRSARHIWRAIRQNDVQALRDVLRRLDVEDVAAVRPLIYALRTQFVIRNETGDALKRYGTRAIADLIGSLKGRAPHFAGEVLAKFGETAVPHLADALRNRNAQVRQWAADVLGRIGDPRAVDPLRAATSDGSGNVRFYALKGLARIKPQAASSEIAHAAEQEPDWGTRREAILTLAKQNPSRAVELLSGLALDLEIGRLACVALRGLGDDGMRALQRLMAGPIEVGQQNAALALGWRDTRAVSILVEILADKTVDHQRRLSASSALWLASDPKAMEVDLHILTDQSEDVRLRAMAARALQGAAGAPYEGALKEALEDQDALVRAGAVYGLASGHYPNAVWEIIRKLADQNGYVRTSSAFALSRLGDPRALEPLLRALADPEWGVRLAAVNALGSLRDPSAAPAIERLLVAETDRFVRDEGLRVLHNLRQSEG